MRAQPSRDNGTSEQLERLNHELQTVTSPASEPSVLPADDPGVADGTSQGPRGSVSGEESAHSPPRYSGVTDDEGLMPEASAPPGWYDDTPLSPPPPYSSLGFDK